MFSWLSIVTIIGPNRCGAVPEYGAVLPKSEEFKMSNNALSVVRCSAILELQALRTRRPAGSFESEIADYAIDLVLNDSRPDGDFLVVNALKDARSVLIRRKRRDKERAFFPMDESEENDVGQEVAHAMIASQRLLAHDIAWQDSYQYLLEAIESQKLLTECLKGWRDGEQLTETADRLDISREYVKKLRGRIRQIAISTFASGGLH